MDMTHLRQGIPNSIVNCAFADFTTLDVCDWNAQSQSNGSWGKHLVSIRYQKQQIGSHGSKQVGKTQDSNANRFGHSDIAIRTEQAFDASADNEAVLLDLLEGMAKFRRKVRPKNHDSKIHRICFRQISQGPVQMPIVGAGGSDDGDSPLHEEIDCCSFSDSRTISLGRYSGTIRQSCSRTPPRLRLATLSFKAETDESHSSGDGCGVLINWSLALSAQSTHSRSETNSSVILPPRRSPCITIGISISGSNPASLMSRSAKSRIRTDLPGLGMNIPPFPSRLVARRTSSTASFRLRKYRSTRGWVTVTGPPSEICSRNVGTTLPCEPKTFPSRTALMGLRGLLHRNNASSANLLDAPITLCGFTALSVDTMTNVVTSCIRALSAKRQVPRALFWTAGIGLFSISGTCLNAAAWITVSGFRSSNISASRAPSHMSPTIGDRTRLPGRTLSSKVI